MIIVGMAVVALTVGFVVGYGLAAAGTAYGIMRGLGW